MTALERLAHDIDVTDTFKRIIDAAISHLDDNVLDRLVVVFGVNTIGCAEFFGQLEFVFVDIDTDDTAGFGHFCADDSSKADTTKQAANSKARTTKIKAD